MQNNSQKRKVSPFREPVNAQLGEFKKEFLKKRFGVLRKLLCASVSFVYQHALTFV